MEKEKSGFDHWVEMFRVTDEQRKVIESKIKKTKTAIKILWPLLIVFGTAFIISLCLTDFKADFTNSFWGLILAVSFFATLWSFFFLVLAYKEVKDHQWDLERDSFYDNLLARSISDLSEVRKKPA